MEPMGYHPSRLNAFFAVMIGYFVNLGAPRLGEVLKCTILARYEKIPAQKLVGTIVAERAFDVICLVLVFGLTFVFQFDIISSLVHDYIYPAFQNKNGETAYRKIILLAVGLIVFLIILKVIFSRFRTYQYCSENQRYPDGCLAWSDQCARFKKQTSVLLLYDRYLGHVPA